MTNKLTHQEMRGVLPAGCRKGKEWETTCPLCGHGHLRLFGDDGIKCMNGCATGDVIAWIRNALKLEPGKRSAHPAVKSTKKAEPSDGISLTQYCQMKGLSELALRVFYSSTAAGTDLERKVNGKPAVAWPYMDATGNVLAYKVRKSRNSHDTFFDPKDPHIPYGLWLSQNGEQPKDLVLCEGESDQQTSTLYNIPALGIPGSQGWRTEYARLPVIKNAERIFVALDSDEDGTKFADKIAKDVHIYRLVFPTKDVNELHVTSPMDEEKTIDGKAIAAVTNPYLRKRAFIEAFDAAVAESLKNEPPELQRHFAYTDTGNAERLVHYHGENFRWLTDENAFCHWTGQVWTKDPTGNVLLPVTKEIARLIPDFEWQMKSESAGKRRAMIEMTKGEPSVFATRELFDQNPMLLNVGNGTIDLETQQLRPFVREDYLTKQALVHYDPTATCPQFEAFLRRIFNNDEELIHYIEKALGYSLTGSAKEQCFFICHGTGANGKSTLFETFRGLLGGDYTASAGFATFVEKKHEDASGYDIARLPGRRMVTTTEPSKSSRLNEELLKLVTGNEVITMRQIYGVPFDFKPECKLWFAMNAAPRIVGTDEGIWRRVHYISFAVQIPKKEQVQDYQTKLVREEGPGILNLLLRGTHDWIREGLKVPSAVDAATRAFRMSQDILSVYFDERTIRGTTLHVKAGLLYENYRQWAESRGEFVMRQNEFFAEVAARGYEKHRVHDDSFHYFGLELRERQGNIFASGAARVSL